MVKDYKSLLKKHLSPSGVLDKELIVDLLLEFLDEKIIDCTLGVNLDISNFLGSTKLGEARGDGARSPARKPWNQKSAHHAGSQQSKQNDGRKPRFQVDNQCLSCSDPQLYVLLRSLYCS